MATAPRSQPSLAEEDAEELVLELGRALARYGAPTHRLEQTLAAVSARLGQEARFFGTPTGLFAWFGPLGQQRSGMVRLDSGGVNLAKLLRLDACVRALLYRDVPPAIVLDEVRAVRAAPRTWPPQMVLLAFAVSSGMSVFFFGGGLVELQVAGLIGASLGLLHLLMDRLGQLHLLEPVGATLAAVLAAAAPALVGPLRSDVVTVAGVLYLLPGLTLTTAVSELATRNLVAGTARLMSAALILIQLAFGVALGSQVARLLPDAPFGPVVPVDLPAWIHGLAVVAASLSFGILFQARSKDLPLIVASSALAFAGARLGTEWFGPQLGAFVGALLVGTGSNLFARVADRPALLPMVPGVLMLVPGSIGFRSVVGLLEQDTVEAVDTAFHMGLVAIALVTGLLVANALLPARRSL